MHLKKPSPKNPAMVGAVTKQLPLLSFSALMRTWPGGLWVFYLAKVFRTEMKVTIRLS